jgi:hypothetical protein
MVRLLTKPLSIALFLTATFACGTSTDSGISVAENTAPKAVLPSQITIPADQLVEIDGRSSFDPEGSSLSFHWSFDSLPVGSSLAEQQAPFSVNHDGNGTTNFQPDAVGVYIVSLIVDDALQASDAAFMIVEATDPLNAPTANAGINISAAVGDLIVLDGSQSHDPLGGALAYDWSIASTPAGSSVSSDSLSDAQAINASFTADVVGDFIATLVVDNGLSSSTSDAVTVHVGGTDNPPSADAGDDIVGFDCDTLPLDCSSSSDPDGDTLSYLWDLQYAPAASVTSNATFDDRTSATPAFFADAAGEYLLTCSVYDGDNWSNPDPVTVSLTDRKSNMPPEVSAGDDTTVLLGFADCVQNFGWTCESCPGTIANLGDTAFAVDPDADPLSLEWVVTSGDAEIIVGDQLLGTADLPDLRPTTGTGCVYETFEFALRATDCPGDINGDAVIVTTQCCGQVK